MLLLADMADNGGNHSQRWSAMTRSSGKYMRWVTSHVVEGDSVWRKAVSAGVYLVDQYTHATL